MRSALLVLDMQANFLDEASHTFIQSVTAILPRVNALIAVFSVMDLPIFLTQYMKTPQDAGLMSAWWRALITSDNHLSQIDPPLEVKNVISICKTRFYNFLDSPLEKLLREKKINQVVICGVMTHLCCETTARAAFMRGIDVFLTIYGMAKLNEAFHRASLLNLAHGFAPPILVQGIFNILEMNRRG